MFETFASQVGVALAIAEHNAALSHLVGGVCHEINNTAGIIPVNVELIRETLERAKGNFDRKAVDVWLWRIEQVAREAADFAQDLLGFSATRLRKKEAVDINDLIRELLSQFSNDVKRLRNVKEVTVQLALSPEPITCGIHTVPFIQVFRNVIINAYQAMEAVDGGTLTIRTFLNDSHEVANIEVQDTGIGIPENDLPHIFNSNFTTKPGGNGLGLWLVKTYLARINGTVSVKSRARQGTIFRIQIPALHP
jgi:signal transduction histidine kinase